MLPPSLPPQGQQNSPSSLPSSMKETNVYLSFVFSLLFKKLNNIGKCIKSKIITYCLSLCSTNFNRLQRNKKKRDIENYMLFVNVIISYNHFRPLYVVTVTLLTYFMIKVLTFIRFFYTYSQFTSRMTSISETEMNIQISLCNVRHVNGMLNISLEIFQKKTH